MIIFIIICVVILLLCIFVPFLRAIFTHPVSSIKYAVLDVYHYFRYKKYNNCPMGFIDIYTGMFGSGKSLSASSRVVGYYNRYNGKPVYDEKTKKWYRSKIHVLSNLELNIPYEHLGSMQQVVDWTTYAPEHPGEWCIVLIDEAAAIFNSRDFKSNLPYAAVNSIVCCRHFRMGMIMCSQRFSQVDKLIRVCTQRAIECKKLWRIQTHFIYDAYEVENVSNPLSVKPKRMAVQFLTDKAFRHYDTMATINQIEKECELGHMRSDQEALEAMAGEASPVAAVPEKRLARPFRSTK